MIRRTSLLSSLALAMSLIAGFAASQGVDESLLKGLKWRNLGPFRGGRVTAVTGVVGEPGTFYMGLPQGGIWKSTSAGQTWFPVFDSIKETSTIGAITLAASDPSIIYAGTGEIPTTGEGNGVYKSTDAGKTWTHLGLEDTRIIPVILVDPKDPNTVLVAATGGRSTKEQRGVFRSVDGGKTWVRWSAAPIEAGVVTMASAADHPEVVVAGTRNLKESSKSALVKSSDFGKTWANVGGKGLPRLAGRYTVAVAQNTNAQRMFVIGNFGLYRSDDGGENWRKMAADDKRIMNGQGNYDCGVYVDTQNPDIVYTISTCLYRSLDGGNTFEGFKGAPGGDDPHFLWIDPTNANRILYGGDQGASVSLDHGANWGSWYNQPSAQVYHIATDNQYPYWVYATQQDSGVVGTSSRGNYGQIGTLDWLPHPGFEFGYVAIDPLNPAISYALSFTLSVARVQYPSGQWVEAGPVADPGESLRAGIMIPIYYSQTNPKELMVGYQYLFSTTDGGQHWKKLGGDIGQKPNTLKDPKDKPTFNKGYISSFSSSSVDGNVIWAGTNNGMVQLTKDHGKTWTWVKTGLPDSGGINCVDSSHHDPATAYVSFGSRDNKPIIYRTNDFGAHWKPIVSGLPTDGPFATPINVVRCDTKRKGLLFAGNDKQIYVSFDDGDHWQSLMLNMPTTIMNDLLVKGDDLVLGTYGRGLWVLDDISPLRQVSDAIKTELAHLFAPATGVRVRKNVNDATPVPPEIPHAENPPVGMSIYYSLAAKPSTPIMVEILDSKGRVVRRMTSAEPEPYNEPKPEIAPYWVGKRQPLPAEIGLNRINWDIRYDDPDAFYHDAQDVMQANVGMTKEAVPGPLALPGKYTVRLTVDGKAYTSPFEVRNDPRSPATQRDLEKSHEVDMNLLACLDAGWESHKGINTLRSSLADALKSDVKAVADAAKEFDEKLESLHGKLNFTRRFFLSPNAKNFVDHNTYLLVVLNSYMTGDSAPSDSVLSSYAGCYYLTVELMDRWRDLNGKQLAALNSVLMKNGLKSIAAVAVPANPPMPEAKFRRKAGAGIGKPAQIRLPEEGHERDGDGNDEGEESDR